MKKITIRITTYFLIGIFGLLISNKAIFIHTHLTSDGSVITHAHPYNKTSDSKPYKSHHHTNQDIQFYQNLELLILQLFASLAILILAANCKTLASGTYCTFFISARIFHGRAPPLS